MKISLLLTVDQINRLSYSCMFVALLTALSHYFQSNYRITTDIDDVFF